MNRDDEIRRTVAEYDSALDTIRKSKAGKATGGQEARLGQAYQHLVRLGARPQIKAKYRG
jgi:hypothetical protein